MKKRKLFINFLFILLLISILDIPVFTMDTKFETSSMSQQKQVEIFAIIKLSMCSVAESSASICTFAVNQNEQIAIGLSNNKINIYNTNCQFQYGYSIDIDGDYYVEWEGQYLLIYSVRGGNAFKVDNNGNCIEVRKIDDSIKNTYYWNDIMKRNKVIINNSIYEIKNEMGILNIFAMSKSKLVKVNPDGEKITVYDVSKRYAILISFIIALIVSSLTIAIVILVKQSGRNLKV